MRSPDCALCGGDLCRANPFHRPDPALSNVVDSTGHWAFPLVVAPLFGLAALFGGVVLVAMIAGRFA